MNKHTQFAYTLEMNLDKKVLERKMYSTLDYFSEIGGLFSILSLIVSLGIGIANSHLLENILITEVYQIKSNDKEGDNKGEPIRMGIV